MAEAVTLYWSFRSPYSYLALPRLTAIGAWSGLALDLKIVLPLAVRDPAFFHDADPLWLPYLIKDAAREAERLGMPIGLPRPDPIQMDPQTGKPAAGQPHIHRLSRLGVLAAEHGAGPAFAKAVSALIWSGSVEAWDKGDHLAQAAARAGLDWAMLRRTEEDEADRLDAVLAAHADAQRADGHWGVPLMVFRGEPFFGQDRIGALIWRLNACGFKGPAHAD